MKSTLMFFVLLSIFMGRNLFAAVPPSTIPSCTVWVSPTGTGNGSQSSPASLTTAVNSIAGAGDVVCILSGTYQVSSAMYPAGGTSSSWEYIVGYGDTKPQIVYTGSGTQSDTSVFNTYSSSFPKAPGYIEYANLSINGQNKASTAFGCHGAAHLAFYKNFIENTGSAGISSVLCDYLTSVGNIIWHCGYNSNQGWSSGISYNSNQFFDSYTGFHSYIVGNIVSGEYDASSYDTDGNGIILDLSNTTYTPPGHTPSTLILNNVVFGNGGRCIDVNIVSNAWVVNNTCYDNTLDTAQTGQPEVDNHSSNTVWFVNNIVVSWNGAPPFLQGGTSISNVIFSHNLIYGGNNQGTPTTGFTKADPLFINPPFYNATQGGQYTNSISGTALGTGLQVEPTSPALGAAIDPTTLTTDPNLISDMKQWVYSDINGEPRTTPFDLGAYERVPTPLPPLSLSGNLRSR